MEFTFVTNYSIKDNGNKYTKCTLLVLNMLTGHDLYMYRRHTCTYTGTGCINVCKAVKPPAYKNAKF